MMDQAPRKVTFNSLGTSCAGDLYLPEVDSPVPGLVLGHSGVMVKEALAVFAAYFVRAGFAVLAIDYRTVGASEGEPRGQDHPLRQVEDFRSAISYLEGRPEVDAARIGLWGVSVGGSVAVQAAVLDRRAKCVVVQSPSVWNGWRYLERLVGHAGVHALRDRLDEDWQRRYEGGASARVPHLSLDGESVRDAPDVAAKMFPSYRNEKTLDSTEQLLTFAPEDLIHRLAPTPLLMIANGGWDPYHLLEEAQSAYAKAGEPKRLEVLPYDVLGLYTGPGLDEAMALAVDWFDRHLRVIRAVTPTPAAEPVAVMTQ
ncbi:alpha/beta hydrolase [Amycolatopsis azurea DSM 43854]|uniref:Alpha/beta hydrolase n=2 Tax=Amycolatopsis azurea TaxID=36819 RepID=M2QBR0_9PSEU|nr:putative hydrolase [Amycolatopsis azurea DSM 43854]OOC08316.1 alpha/beta hydrolase [Amycolatopsis azurea DSM 43854]